MTETRIVPPRTWIEMDGVHVYHEAGGNVPIAAKVCAFGPAAQTYVEWRVTADPDYEFIWSPLRNPHLGDAEAAARRFVEQVATSGHLTNVKLAQRTVTIDQWEERRS